MNPEQKFFLSQRREKLRALDNCRVHIRADEVDIKDVEHIQHRDQRRRDADAERQAVQNFLRRKRADSQIPRCREQHHHTAAVVAAKPPERGPRREESTVDTTPDAVTAPSAQSAGRLSTAGGPDPALRRHSQRAEPERERPAPGCRCR